MNWQVLLTESDGIFHPFSITLENDMLFWTDWANGSIFSTHKLNGSRIITVYNNSFFFLNGIEAVTPERQAYSEWLAWFVCLCLTCLLSY